MAEGQNWARDLMETPSNYKYPELLAEKVAQHFMSFGNVDVVVRYFFIYIILFAFYGERLEYWQKFII